MSSEVVDLIEEDVNLNDSSDSLALFQTVTVLKEKKTEKKKTSSLKENSLKETVVTSSVSSSNITTSLSSTISSCLPVKARSRRVPASTINKMVREVNSLLPQDKEIFFKILQESTSCLEIVEKASKNDEITPKNSFIPLSTDHLMMKSMENDEKELYSLRLQLGNLLAEQAEARNREKKLRAQIKKIQKSVANEYEKSISIFENFTKPIEGLIMEVFPLDTTLPAALHPLALFGSSNDIEKCEEDPIIQENINQSNKISFSCPLWSCCTYKVQERGDDNFEEYIKERRVDPERDAVILEASESLFPNSQSTIVRSQSFTNNSYKEENHRNSVEICDVSQLFSQTIYSQEVKKYPEIDNCMRGEDEEHFNLNLSEEYSKFDKEMTEKNLNEIISFVSIDVSISSLISFYLDFIVSEKYMNNSLKINNLIYFFLYMLSNKFKDVFFSPRNFTQAQYKKNHEEIFSLFCSLYSLIKSSYNYSKPILECSTQIESNNSENNITKCESPMINSNQIEEFKSDALISPVMSQMIDLISPQSLLKTGESVEGVNINKIQKVLDLFAYDECIDEILADSRAKENYLHESEKKIHSNSFETENNIGVVQIDEDTFKKSFEKEEKSELNFNDVDSNIKEFEQFSSNGESDQDDEEDESDEENKDDDEMNEEVSESNINNEFDYNFNSDCEYDNDFQDTETFGVKELNLASLRSFLMSSIDFYRDILVFQPINLDVLYEKLKEEDFKLPHKLKILPLLDELEVFVSIQREKKSRKRYKSSSKPSKRIKKS